MSALTIFGWIVLLGVGGYVAVSGVVMAYVEGGFTGRTGPVSWIMMACGVAIIALAVWLCPFDVRLRP